MPRPLSILLRPYVRGYGSALPAPSAVVEAEEPGCEDGAEAPRASTAAGPLLGALFFAALAAHAVWLHSAPQVDRARGAVRQGSGPALGAVPADARAQSPAEVQALDYYGLPSWVPQLGAPERIVTGGLVMLACALAMVRVSPRSIRQDSLDFQHRMSALQDPAPNIYRLVAVMPFEEIERAGRSPMFLVSLAALTAFLQVHLPFYLLTGQLDLYDLVGVKKLEYLTGRWHKVLTTVPAMFTMATIFIKGTQTLLSEELVRDYFLLTVSQRDPPDIESPSGAPHILQGGSPSLAPTESMMSGTRVPNLSASNLFYMTKGRRLWTKGNTRWKNFWCSVSALVMLWLGLNMICVMLLCIATTSGDYTDFVLHVMGNFFVYSLPELIMTAFPLCQKLYSAEWVQHLDRRPQPGTIWEWLKPMHAIAMRLCDIMLSGGLVFVFITYWEVHATGIHVGPFINPSASAQTFF